MKKKIAVLVSGGGTNLGALIKAQNEGGIPDGEITLVISSNPNAYALTRAKDAQIPSLVVDRKSFDTSLAFDEAILNALKDERPDVIVLAGFMYILGKAVINEFKNKIINVHPALIPSFCGKGFYGLKVHDAAIKSGVKLTGATVHFVNEMADDGPIILQKAVEVFYGDTPEILQKRVMEQAEWVILPEAVSLICSKQILIKNNIAYRKEELK